MRLCGFKRGQTFEDVRQLLAGWKGIRVDVNQKIDWGTSHHEVWEFTPPLGAKPEWRLTFVSDKLAIWSKLPEPHSKSAK
jgi:hypothetical protein